VSAAHASGARRKGYRGLPMEGTVARRYADLRGTESQLAGNRAEAARLTGGLPDGAAVLEVAPGPGYFAVEMARPGRLDVTALDISATFVEIAREHARREGVAVEVRQGDAADLPFADGSFDLVVCQAAFKNFSDPAGAIAEMHRVLRPGGAAVIQDMRHEATRAEIRGEVAGMRLGWLSALSTRLILGRLRRRAYTRAQFESMAAASPFGGAEIQVAGIGIEVRMVRR
jgi:ubiquinone/menaquinone biosynthesis C-methylase UbiE